MANQELVQLATIDVLTELPNRYYFQTELRHRCALANNEKFEVGVLFIDLDGFKAVNDNLGHNAGDQLLQCVADRLRDVVAKQVNDSVLIARLGGDEFTILVERSNADNIQQSLLIPLVHAIAQPIYICDEKVTISASIGFASQQGPYVVPDSLLRQADMAMYQAKNLGKNQFFVSSRELYNDTVESVSDLYLDPLNTNPLNGTH